MASYYFIQSDLRATHNQPRIFADVCAAMELDSRLHAAGMKSNNPNRVLKKRRSKSKTSIVFTSYNKRKGSGSAGKQKK
jgi:hypothetical protein